jgi:hypothetical protein
MKVLCGRNKLFCDPVSRHDTASERDISIRVVEEEKGEEIL